VTVKQGGKDEGDRLGFTCERMGPSFVVAVRSVLDLVAKMMPIVGGRHPRFRAPLAEPCALDLLPMMRIANSEAPRSAVDCSVLEMRQVPLFDPLVMGNSLCPLGKQQIEASFSARGEANSARSRLNLNLRMWSKMFVSFNLAMGRDVGKLLGRFAGSGLGL